MGVIAPSSSLAWSIIGITGRITMRIMGIKIVRNLPEPSRMPDRETSGTQNAVSRALRLSGWMPSRLITRPPSNAALSMRASCY